jgi:hypothetical protein
MLRNLDNEYLEFDNETQKLLNKSFTSSANDKMTATIEFKDNNDESQSIKSGKETIKQDETVETDEKELNDLEKELLEEEKKEKEISFTKDVLPFVIPLTCILTMNDANKDFVKMLSDIRDNPELLEVFDEQSLIWWNKKDLINIIKNIVEKFINKNSNTFNISINFKMGLKSLIDKPKELLELINECLKPKEIEKKKFGEVFTPMNLVNEMLDKLPKEVWTNKNLKWLDPCVGMGNFMIGVYLKLMEGLKKEIPDDKKRKKHILEKMLYMCELNKKNCYIVKQIFNINNEYKLNIYEGDFLKFDSNKIFKVDKFNVILGNPPYNASGTKATGNTIWQEFLTLSINENLINDGYLCFIHPCGWRKPNTSKGKFNGLYDLMAKDNTILYLEIHNTKDGMKTFNCGTRYDWYILQKKKSNNKTNILDEKGISHKLNIQNYDWLGNYELDLIHSLIADKNDEKCQIMQSMSAYEPRKVWISKTKTKEFKYPVVHSTPKEGHRFVWSNKNDNGFYGISKIIFGDSGIYDPIIDINGTYAMTQHAMAIKIDTLEEGNKLKEALTSDKFKNILNACSWSSFAIEWNMFKYFKKDFYKYFIENNDKVKVIKKSISKKIQKDSDSEEEEKPKITKVKRNKSTVNK